MNIFIHRTAIIDPDVIIQDGSKVWAFSHLMKGSSIGKNCIVGEGVHIGSNVNIGDNCKIQNHALIYEGVEIGDDVFIGPGVVTTNDIFPRADLDWSKRFRRTKIKNGASIGANATIICGITIGENSLIAAGSVVTKDVPPNTIVRGNPAKYHKTLYPPNSD